jgi:transcriptional regulator with XRE-family HTH domain
MRYWLGRAARAMREEADRMIIDIAVRARTTESTVSRFETAKTQPSNIDAMIAAYAKELGVEPIEVWLRAIQLWTDRQATPDSGVLLLEDTARRARAAAQARTRTARGEPRGKRK